MSGPVGTGPLTFAFVYLEDEQIPIITGANNSGGNTAELYSTPVITLHNQVNFVNSGFREGGAQVFGGGQFNLAGPINMEGTNNVMIVANEQSNFSGVISGSGTLLYTGDTNNGGPGYLVISGDNNFTGGIVFGSPTGNDSNSGLTNDLTVGNSNALGAGPFVYVGGILQDDGQNPYTITNPVELDSTAAHTLYVSSTANNLTFTGTFTGPGGLAKTGPGNLVLSGAATYLGATSVSFGTLTLQGGASITYSSSIAVGPASTLTLDNTGTNSVNRIGAGIVLTLTGGALNFLGNASALPRRRLAASF